MNSATIAPEMRAINYSFLASPHGPGDLRCTLKRTASFSLKDADTTYMDTKGRQANSEIAASPALTSGEC